MIIEKQRLVNSFFMPKIHSLLIFYFYLFIFFLLAFPAKILSLPKLTQFFFKLPNLFMCDLFSCVTYFHLLGLYDEIAFLILFNRIFTVNYKIDFQKVWYQA